MNELDTNRIYFSDSTFPSGTAVSSYIPHQTIKVGLSASLSEVQTLSAEFSDPSTTLLATRDYVPVIIEKELGYTRPGFFVTSFYSDHAIVDGLVLDTTSSLSGIRVIVPPFVAGVPVTEIGSSFDTYANAPTAEGWPKNASISSFVSESVTAVGASAFVHADDEMNRDLVEVYVPKAVSIGNSAFFGCENLKTVVMDAANSIENGLFSGCSSLSSLFLPNVTSISGSGTFSGCQSLKAVYFGEKIPEISVATSEFPSECSSLTVFYPVGSTAWNKTSVFMGRPTSAYEPDAYQLHRIGPQYLQDQIDAITAVTVSAASIQYVDASVAAERSRATSSEVVLSAKIFEETARAVSAELDNRKDISEISSTYVKVSHVGNIALTGDDSIAGNLNLTGNASIMGAFAQGNSVSANGKASHAEGENTEANGVASHAGGINSRANSPYSYAWNGISENYSDHGQGTFNISPSSGASGFYIGEKSLSSYLKDEEDRAKTAEGAISAKLASAMHYKGSVEKYSDLPATGNETGDVWNVNETGKNYAWNGTTWDELSGVMDLSDYVTKAMLSSEEGNRIAGDIALLKSLTSEVERATNAESKIISDSDSKYLSGKYIGPEFDAASSLSSVVLPGIKATSSGITITPQLNTGKILAGGYVNIQGESEFGYGITRFDANGNTIFYNTPKFTTGVSISGNTSLSGTESVTGEINLYGNSSITGNVSISGKLSDGDGTSSIGNYSHAEGMASSSIGAYSHAEGNFTRANGNYSHAEGFSSIADGDYSYAWNGVNSVSYTGKGAATFSINPTGGTSGFYIGPSSLANYLSLKANQSDFDAATSDISSLSANYVKINHIGGITLKGNDSITGDIDILGNQTISGTVTISGEMINGEGCSAAGYLAHAEGGYNNAAKTYSHAEGFSTTSNGTAAHTEGWNTKANSDYAHAEGLNTSANGYVSHTEGGYTLANADYAHAEGDSTKATGSAAHSEGWKSLAAGAYSHAEGSQTTANGTAAHSEGVLANANNNYSYVWNSDQTAVYNDKGAATFSINPTGGTSGFYIGPSSLAAYLNTKANQNDFNTVTANVTTISGDVGKLVTSASTISENLGTVSSNLGTLTTNFNAATGDISSISANYVKINHTGNITLSGSDAITGDVTVNGNETIYGILNNGKDCVAAAAYSHAEGYAASSTGENSHAEGEYTQAIGKASHAEGQYAISNGHGSHAEGYRTTAQDENSHAEGSGTQANGRYSHAEGVDSVVTVSGYGAHAEGSGTYADGQHSHSEGSAASSFGWYSHAEGESTNANGYFSHAEGGYTYAYGGGSHAEGESTSSMGNNSHAEGGYTQANGDYSHAEGRNTSSVGTSSHAEGGYTYAYGGGSHAEGDSTSSMGDNSHAEGGYTQANGNYSHAEGGSTNANGYFSHAEGQNTSAAGWASHAEGDSTSSMGNNSHAEGGYTQANGNYSHAEGISSIADGDYSYAWNGIFTASYTGHGEASYSINPTGGTAGFYIGPSSLANYLALKANSTDFNTATGNISTISGSVTGLTVSATTISGNLGTVSSNLGTLTTNFNAATGNINAISGVVSSVSSTYVKINHNGNISLTGTDTVSGSISLIGNESITGNIALTGKLSNGNSCSANGAYSHAEGARTNAVGIGSYAAGSSTVASGDYSIAVGVSSVSPGAFSYAWNGLSSAQYIGKGVATFSINPTGGTSGFYIGPSSLANYLALKAGQSDFNTATSNISTVSSNLGTVSSNLGTLTTNFNAATSNINAISGVVSSVSSTYVKINHIGDITLSGSDAITGNVTVNGNETIYGILNNGKDCVAAAAYSHAEGYAASSTGENSHAEGESTSSMGNNSHAEGGYTQANGDYSHAEGQNTSAAGWISHAEGGNTYAYGGGSHAEGDSTSSMGDNSHAEGGYTQANGYLSHAEGQNTFSVGASSHAEGGNTYAYGGGSHAEGDSTSSMGDNSHAEGGYTQANGNYSHAEGISSIADGDYSYAWNGVNSVSYTGKGAATFSINPTGGTSGFYIGPSSLANYLDTRAEQSDLTSLSAKYGSIGTILTYKGSVATSSALPSAGNTVGDFYTITGDGSSYAWNGTSWVSMGTLADVSSMSQTLWQKSADLGSESSFTLNLSGDITIYKTALTAATTISSFVLPTTPSGSDVATFELAVTMPSTVYTLNFPTVSWLGGSAPDMSTSSCTYLFAFRTMDAGSTWIGNLQGTWA